MRHVFIVGSKGIPSNYGGYETFVDKLTEYQQNNTDIRYHVACAVDTPKEIREFQYHNAHCFTIIRKKIGSAQAVLYDIDALKYCIKYIKENKIYHPLVYVLACRIGPFFYKYVSQIHRLGGKVYVNPDGHEWMRTKWIAPIRKYWKISERLMIKRADLLICDSKNIEKYIEQTYAKYRPKTTYIAYGAEIRKSMLTNEEKLLNWYKEKGIQIKEYYLVVGRFVPENNYEIMIREFMKSHSKKDFILVTNISDNFLEELREKTNFDNDKRIKFVGTVYDKEFLMKIRENAYAYIHGHEVGGTNPSLLEALASTDLNLLLDVGFNREVAENAALYWNKNEGDLARLIDEVDELSDKAIKKYGELSTKRIQDSYSWEYISERYKSVFLYNINDILTGVNT